MDAGRGDHVTALKSRLALNASVQRDGGWKFVPSAEWVPNDLIKLSLGAVVAADVKILDGLCAPR
jgi:H+-transporting ATPase